MGCEDRSWGSAGWGAIVTALALLVAALLLAPSAPGSTPPPGGPVRATPTPSPCYGLTYNVVCGTTMIATTTAGASYFDTYACTPWLESGPEVFHTLTLPAGGFWQLSGSLRNVSVDLDVFILGPQGCSPSLDCRDFGDVSAVIGGLPGGATYHVVVDGFAGAAGSYSLDIDCVAENLVFADGLESGTTLEWSQTSP